MQFVMTEKTFRKAYNVTEKTFRKAHNVIELLLVEQRLTLLLKVATARSS
jgi:hypothetical protein